MQVFISQVVRLAYGGNVVAMGSTGSGAQKTRDGQLWRSRKLAAVGAVDSCRSLRLLDPVQIGAVFVPGWDMSSVQNLGWN